MVEYVEMVTGNEDTIKERNWGVGRIICITVEVTETREERKARSSLVQHLYHIMPWPPTTSTNEPRSSDRTSCFKTQSEYSAQNSCHGWVMSGNVVPILALSCTSSLMTWPYISLHWIQVQTTFPHFELGCSFFCLPHRKAMKGVFTHHYPSPWEVSLTDCQINFSKSHILKQ